MSVDASIAPAPDRTTMRIIGYGFFRPASSYGVIGIPVATNHFAPGSQVIGRATFPLPGIGEPVSPTSTGGAAPKSASAQSQKLVLPSDVVLIEPVGSAIAS